MRKFTNKMREPIELGGIHEVVDEANDGTKAIPIVFVNKSGNNESFTYDNVIEPGTAVRNRMKSPVARDSRGNSRVVDEDIEGQKAIPFVAVTKDENGRFVYADIGGGGGGGNVSDINEIDGVLRREKTDLVTFKSLTNLFDKSTVTAGYVYMNTGAYQAFSGYSTSALIAVTPGKTYSKKTRGHYTFWTGSGTFVSGIASAVGIETFTVPNNPAIKYMRFAIQDSAIANEMMVEGTTLPSFYIPFGEVISDYYLADDIKVTATVADGLTGVKWAVMGDSISSLDYATKPYQDWIADRTGVVVSRHAITGSAITKESGRSDAMCERWSSMVADADIITVMGGRNDFTRSLPIGTMEDRVNTTLYGACHILFGGLVDKYKGKRIGVILPPQRPYDESSPYNDNETTFDYLDAIQEVAEYYSIPVLDLFRQGGLAAKVPSIRTALYFDNVHPNNAGQEVMSRKIEAFLKTL